jgi:hypothetical protein
MKWSMMLRETTLQMNLEAENDHERKALDILREHQGQATLHNGANLRECMGGYLRDFGESTCLAITIKQAKETP